MSEHVLTPEHVHARRVLMVAYRAWQQGNGLAQPSRMRASEDIERAYHYSFPLERRFGRNGNLLFKGGELECDPSLPPNTVCME